MRCWIGDPGPRRAHDVGLGRRRLAGAQHVERGGGARRVAGDELVDRLGQQQVGDGVVGLARAGDRGQHGLGLAGAAAATQVPAGM